MKLLWDQAGQRLYETGVDHGVLYSPTNGVYGPGSGVAWNGLMTVSESPSGAESTKTYADNIPYLNLISIEEFSGTIEGFTFPDQWLKHDGAVVSDGGVIIQQQNRMPFGFSYRTRIGNDIEATDYGYKIHIIYNATAAPSERSNTTINDSPEPMNLSWEFSTIPIPVGVLIDGKEPKPTSHIIIDSTKVDADALAALEEILYGTAGVDARLPMPAEVLALFDGTITEVSPSVPTFVSPNITIPSVTGVEYRRGDTDAVVAAGTVTIAGASGTKLVIYALPKPGYVFPDGIDDDWMYTKA